MERLSPLALDYQYRCAGLFLLVTTTGKLMVYGPQRAKKAAVLLNEKIKGRGPEVARFLVARAMRGWER